MANRKEEGGVRFQKHTGVQLGFVSKTVVEGTSSTEFAQEQGTQRKVFSKRGLTSSNSQP